MKPRWAPSRQGQKSPAAPNHYGHYEDDGPGAENLGAVCGTSFQPTSNQIMVDFYSDDFDAQLAALDPEVPYVVYCRSDNRSGQTIAKMETIGFQSVDDIDGGVVARGDAGMPLVR